MEISPMRIFWMLVFSLGFGAVCGVLNDVNRLVRVLFGVRYRKDSLKGLYKIKLPIVGRSLSEIKESRLKRLLLPVIIFVQDVFLFLFFSVGVVMINYYFNDGRVRIYTPIVAICGFLIYYFTLGRLVLYFSEALAFALRGIFFVFLSIFYRPIRFFVDFLVKIIKKMYKKLYKAIAKRQKMVYNNNSERIVMKKAACGFVEITKK